MAFIPPNEPEDLLWWDLIADYPELGEGLEELSMDTDSGVVTAVGLFTLLKLRFWHSRRQAPLPLMADDHHSDDTPAPQASRDYSEG